MFAGTTLVKYNLSKKKLFYIFITFALFQRLLTSDVVFESLPLTLSLPPEAVNYSVTLMGYPKETGELEITGKCFASTNFF